MFKYDTYLEPPCDPWLQYDRQKFIEQKIQEICKSISEKGDRTYFSEVFDHLYEYIQDNIEKFLEEKQYD